MERCPCCYKKTEIEATYVMVAIDHSLRREVAAKPSPCKPPEVIVRNAVYWGQKRCEPTMDEKVQHALFSVNRVAEELAHLRDHVRVRARCDGSC